MDKFRTMQTFLAIAEAGSLSAAGRLLAEPLTNVSRHLTQLEHHLGCTLVNRTSQKMVLTPEGQEYLNSARIVIEEMERVEALIKEVITGYYGRILVTAPITLGKYHLLPVISEFLDAHPKVNARLEFVDRAMDLIEEGVDVAVRVGKLGNSGLLSIHVGNVRPVVCASPDYIAKRGKPTSVAELAKRDCIVFHGAFGDFRWTFSSAALGRHSVRLCPRISVNTIEAAISAAEDGMGITRVLSYQVSSSIQAGRLVEILPEFDDTQIPVHLLRLPNRQARALVQEFFHFSARRLRARLLGEQSVKGQQ